MAYQFTSGQKQFIKSLSARTGLNQRVVAAWVFSEMNGGAARGYQSKGYNNWLNIGHTDSGNLGLTKSGVWSSPDRAAAATADFLRGKRFGPGPGIKKIIKYAGSSPEKQISAIANSGWASSSYEKGATLRSIYSGLGGQFAGQPKPKAPKAPKSSTGGTPASAADTQSLGMQQLLAMISDRSSTRGPVDPIKPRFSRGK